MSPSRRPVLIELILLRHAPDSPTRIAYRTVVGELLADEPPDDAAARLADPRGAPVAPDTLGTSASTIQVLHSTSWRHDSTGTVTLTYAALPDPRPDLAAVHLIAPAVVCSGDPLRPAPDELHGHHIAAHAVRHLAYLADRDPGIALVCPDHERADHERADHERADHERAHHERARREQAHQEQADHEQADLWRAMTVAAATMPTGTHAAAHSAAQGVPRDLPGLGAARREARL